MANKGTSDPGMGFGGAVYKGNKIYSAFMLAGADRETDYLEGMGRSRASGWLKTTDSMSPRLQ